MREFDNGKYYPYDISKKNWHGPRNAIVQLITTSQWSNVYLSNTERKIVNEYNTTSTKDNNHSFPEVLSYSNYEKLIFYIAKFSLLFKNIN